MASRHASIRDGVLRVIKDLNLSGLSADNVLARKVPVDRSLTSTGSTLPAIVVCAYGTETESADAAMGALTDSFGYPISVVIHEASNQVYTADDTALTWREQIVDAFHKRRLLQAAVRGVYKVTVEFGAIIDLNAWQTLNMALSFLTLRAYMHRERGTSNNPAP